MILAIFVSWKWDCAVWNVSVQNEIIKNLSIIILLTKRFQPNRRLISHVRQIFSALTYQPGITFVYTYQNESWKESRGSLLYFFFYKVAFLQKKNLKQKFTFKRKCFPNFSTLWKKLFFNTRGKHEFWLFWIFSEISTLFSNIF